MSGTDDGNRAQRETLLDPGVIECPFPLYEEMLRSEQPWEDPGVGLIVSRYDEVRQMALNTREFSSSIAGAGGPLFMGVSPEPLSPEVEALIAQYHPMVNALFTADPPQHTRHRALVTKALNPRRVRALEGTMREIANALIDEFVDDGRCELLSQFAVGLPLSVIADTLGVDRADMNDFKRWTDCIVAGNVDVLDNDRRAEVARAVIAFQQYMLPRIEERRQQPRDDLLSDLANARIEDDDVDVTGPRQLSTEELLPILSQLLSAGNETTTNLIGNGMVTLIEHPDAMAELRADHSLLANFIEEVLRFDGPLHCTFRRARGEVELGGRTLADGTLIAPMWGAACQDWRVFPDPRTFDIHRANARRHMTFGVGPHFCVGAELARLEGRIAFEALLTRLDDIRLAPDAELTRIDSFAAHGYREVRIEFSAAP